MPDLSRTQREQALALAVDLYGHNPYTPMPEQVIRTAEAFAEWLAAGDSTGNPMVPEEGEA